MKITYYGHSCFSVTIKGSVLLFDPFISGNPLASAINPRTLPADYILVSHGHSDHIGDTSVIARQTGARIISNFEITEWFTRQRLENVHALNHGGGFEFPFGRVKLVNAIHSSSLPDGTYGGNPGGFVVESVEGNFYYSGDTALTMDMKLIPEWTTLDFACLPLGDNFTMGVADAIRAADFVRCKKVLGLHYNTFPQISINLDEAKRKFAAAGIELLLPGLGESCAM